MLFLTCAIAEDFDCPIIYLAHCLYLDVIAVTVVVTLATDVVLEIFSDVWGIVIPVGCLYRCQKPVKSNRVSETKGEYGNKTFGFTGLQYNPCNSS